MPNCPRLHLSESEKWSPSVSAVGHKFHNWSPSLYSCMHDLDLTLKLLQNTLFSLPRCLKSVTDYGFAIGSQFFPVSIGMHVNGRAWIGCQKQKQIALFFGWSINMCRPPIWSTSKHLALGLFWMLFDISSWTNTFKSRNLKGQFIISQPKLGVHVPSVPCSAHCRPTSRQGIFLHFHWLIFCHFFIMLFFRNATTNQFKGVAVHRG